MRPLLAALLALVLAPAASAQTPPPEEPVGPVSYTPFVLDGERPAQAPRSTKAPSRGDKVDVQAAYLPRDAAEPTLGVDAKGRGFYAAGAFDALPGSAPRQLARTEIFRSLDGGVNWTEATPKVGSQDMAPTTLDPFVWVDQITGRVFSIDLYLAGSYLSYSDDGGQTWLPSTIKAPGVNDHQTFFTGPKPKSSPIPDPSPSYRTNAYYCVNALTAVTCSRSTDGGVTFQPLPSSPYTECLGCQTGHGRVAPNGDVLLPRAEYLSLTGNMRVELAISKDGGATWKTVEVAKGVPAGGRHTSVAADSAGNVYYTWFDGRDKLPWLAVSKDGGTTWGKPMMVAPPGVHDVNFPVVTAGDEGRIALAFPGSSVDAPTDETRPWHAWVLVSDDALAEAPTFHATPADDGTDPLHRGTCENRCKGMFDFIDIQTSPVDGSAWATFTDTCTDEAACSTTRASGRATDARGMAVRTVGGPSLLDGKNLKRPSAQPATALRSASPVAMTDRRAPDLTATAAGWRASEAVSLDVAVRRGDRVVSTLQTGRPATSGRLPLDGVTGTLEVRATDGAGNTTQRTLTLR